MDAVPFYEAARNAGLLTEVTLAGATVHGAFRAADDTVLDGLALAREHQLEYPAAWLHLAAGDTLQIGGQSYRVRAVRLVGDGSECRASLSPD
ncbi:head-tail joining protein [Serpentinimonas maccroryi]|uniref:head-tail joining protein n=1 Tax=Serpentinimonas maccroryi TaxID=1458426 RepID=UPI002033318E|nr:hypothetical protein [Serpentinimonas maccroryi]MCM2479203.1 hypothetical protein [Serpentinimonas maccroryi]